MAISTYQTLRQALVDWSKRSDSLTMLDTFIQLCESEIYGNGTQNLRIRDMETTLIDQTNTSDRFMPLPDGFLEMRRIAIETVCGYQPLEFLVPQFMHVHDQKYMPSAFTVTSQIEFNCVSQTPHNVEMVYYKTLDPISETNVSNAALTRFPNIYLQGSLAALFQWAKQPDLASYHYQQFIATIGKANHQDKRGRYGPAPSIRVVGATP